MNGLLTTVIIWLMSTESSMASMRVGVLLVVALLPAIVSAQSRDVTITEPGVYKISDLFKAADTVAVVKVLSGDRTTSMRFTKAR